MMIRINKRHHFLIFLQPSFILGHINFTPQLCPNNYLQNLPDGTNLYNDSFNLLSTINSSFLPLM